jgi:hypothetical protein
MKIMSIGIGEEIKNLEEKMHQSEKKKIMLWGMG